MAILNFKGINHIGESTISMQLETNIVAWFDWCQLNIGGFSNIEYGESGEYGGNLSQLRNAEAPGFSQGQVWEGFRKNWVWETGINYDYQPVRVTGIKIDNTFYPTGARGTYAFSVNYPLGRIEFDNAIPTGSVVTAQFSHKYYSFEPASVDWFREIAYRSFRADDATFFEYGSGFKTVFDENRIQLPAVVVEVLPSRKWTPLQLGGGKWCYVGVQWHIFAETPYDRNRIVDIITMQTETTISGFDFNKMQENSGIPLTPHGSIWSGTKVYPQLLNDYPWGTIRFMDLTGYEVESEPPLYRAIVRGMCELYCPGL
jgi:hypothetical protein